MPAIESQFYEFDVWDGRTHVFTGVVSSLVRVTRVLRSALAWCLAVISLFLPFSIMLGTVANATFYHLKVDPG